MSFAYGSALHREETIAALAERWVAALAGLVDHCLSPEAGGYTPSDFPLAGLDQAALDELAAGARDLDDVYPLTPLQQGMLFHSLSAPRAGSYITQFQCDLVGKLDLAAFGAAWQRVVDRHPVLRTGFVWEGTDEPLQVVRRRAAL